MVETLSGAYHEMSSGRSLHLLCRNLLTSMVLGSLMLFFSGCSAVGPDYVRPDMPMPEKWNAGTGRGIIPGPTDQDELALWWSTLNDPVLSGFIERAVKANPDLRKARARVRQARARHGISKAGLFPSVDASGAM